MALGRPLDSGHVEVHALQPALVLASEEVCVIALCRNNHVGADRALKEEVDAHVELGAEVDLRKRGEDKLDQRARNPQTAHHGTRER